MNVRGMRWTIKVGGIAAAACFAALCGAVPAPAAEPPTAKELYRQALVVMNDLKEPPYVTYRVEGTSEGLSAEVTTRGGCAHLEETFGNSRHQWTARHRTLDSKTELVDVADGRRFVVDHDRYVANFDPTWLTTYRALRHPIDHPCETPPALNLPTPVPTIDPAAPALKTIGTVVALGPGIYDVEDRGAAACPNGDPGHALHLWSHTHNPRQELSDVVIDLRWMRFCTIRFGSRNGAGFGSATFEQHFADVGGYWIMTDGVVEITARVAGIAAGHGVWRYRLSDFEFPNSLPAEAFVPPAAP
jgi:hypothetical protein